MATPTQQAGTQASPVSPEMISQKLDLAISLVLHAWPALSVAVTEHWGGPDSSAKRDWFAGAISDLFAARPDTDEGDIEDMVLQIMGDEFDCQLEDESEMAVAADIMRFRKLTAQGQFDEVDRLYEQWVEKQKKGPERHNLQVIDHGEHMEGVGEDDEDDDDDDDDDDEEDGGVDIEMTDAAEPSQRREKPEPEVDEEGFTKVVGKKRR